MPPPAPYEVSHGLLCLKSGRLLAPAATLATQRLGETVVVAISDDDAESWPRHAVAMRDPQGQHGFFEQKLAQLPDGRVLCVAWTVTLDQVVDCCNHYTISDDGGLTWSEPRATDVMGQTMTPLPLDDRHLLILYNRRYGRQGVVMQIVNFARERWDVTWEGMLYDPGTERDRQAHADGLRELDTFAFGFPTAIRLHDGAILATWWAKPGAASEVRWARLELVG
jgi:hypothetical protein